ncbi:MAG TPA: A/G-specific adenine glycosylase [Azoarcus sp.]|nr:A/G-specific adenine glycosylase [Azoarcus sp.]
MTTETRFAARLLEWHVTHGRHDLPWQATRAPYHVWLSEIMLQQTRVETVIPYYRRFLERFPDLDTLAAAPVEDVLALWSGLGYYARARNLHKAARIVIETHNGRFPRQADQIATLPGIGRSTAAAIAAFCFNERGAILDGNVKRVLCRVFGIEGFPGERKVETTLWTLAESLLPEKNIGTYIQAQMDLGATVCTRGRPACERCPFTEQCVAYTTNRVAQFPEPRPKKAVPQRRVRVAVIEKQGHVLMERRPPSGIWGGLLALPEIAHDAEMTAEIAHRFGLKTGPCQPLTTLRHVFSHFRLDIEPMHCVAHGATLRAAEDRLEWLALNALDEAGLPAPVRRILESLEIKA